MSARLQIHPPTMSHAPLIDYIVMYAAEDNVNIVRQIKARMRADAWMDIEEGGVRYTPIIVKSLDEVARAKAVRNEYEQARKEIEQAFDNGKLVWQNDILVEV